MGEQKNGGEKKKKGDGGEKKKEDNPNTVVLKIDIHCEGCATKIKKCVDGFEGVENSKVDSDANKVTIIGKVEPLKLQEKLAEKTKKKVDLISPQPSKKDTNNNDNKKKADENINTNKPDEKKPKEKEPPVTTAVLKLRLHCQGCIEKIRKAIIKTKGFNDMSIDKQKELVTVKGSMDMKALAESLKERLKRPVEIVPPKKDNKDKDGDVGANKGGGGGGKKKGGGGDGGQELQEGEAGIGKMQERRMEFQPGSGFGYGYGHPPVVQPGYGYGYPPVVQPGYGYPPVVQPGYGYGYPPGYAGEHVHPPQMFSDENPNACSIM